MIHGLFQDVPPVLAAPHHYLISIQRGGVALVAVCKQEVAPLFVIEFLHRVVDTFQVCIFLDAKTVFTWFS